MRSVMRLVYPGVSVCEVLGAILASCMMVEAGTLQDPGRFGLGVAAKS